VVGKRLHELGGDSHPPEFWSGLWRELQENGLWSGEIMDRRQGGEPFPSWALINAVRDANGNLLHYIGICRDITVLKRNEQELQRLAFYDTLTGLPNRALFRDRLTVAHAGATRHETPLAVMYLDLDRFKYVNDTLGHAAGDQLLIEIGRRVGACLRDSDTLARMGGDEFTILLTHFGDEAAALRVADRIVAAVGEPMKLGDETVYVGASLGIAFHPKDGADAATLQKHADMAMYVAKESGRGQYRVFDPAMLAQTDQRLSLSVQIENALKNDEFSLVYQPVIDVTTDKPQGIEALIRWNKPGEGLVEPGAFLPHAEEAGLIKKIDCWVLERACRDTAKWAKETNLVLPVSVNLSAVSLQQFDMPGQIKDILTRTGLAPTLLSLEITESAVKTDPNTVQAVLEEITAIGVKFAVNDFGTGYASLGYISQFPIKSLKLSRRFVDRIGSDKPSEEIIETLLHLARRLNIEVVANGVERPDQQAFLSKMGCNLMQGYRFLKPMSGDKLRNWLREPMEEESSRRHIALNL
jgi:diguanylate cyclase (GGDEF)-like protein